MLRFALFVGQRPCCGLAGNYQSGSLLKVWEALLLLTCTQVVLTKSLHYTIVILNISADVMRQRGAKHILAIDVGSEDTNNFTQYGDYLSGYRVKVNNYK